MLAAVLHVVVPELTYAHFFIAVPQSNGTNRLLLLSNTIAAGELTVAYVVAAVVGAEVGVGITVGIVEKRDNNNKYNTNIFLETGISED